MHEDNLIKMHGRDQIKLYDDGPVSHQYRLRDEKDYRTTISIQDGKNVNAV